MSSGQDGREDERVVTSANPSRMTPACVDVVLARALAATDAGPRPSRGQEGGGKEVRDGLGPSGKGAEEHGRLDGHGVGPRRDIPACTVQQQ